MEEKKLIEFRNIVKSFDGQIVLKGINLDIFENEFVTLLGPSGCGKTTLLRILGGFLDADEGSVIFDGEEISKKPPYERELNTVFQKYALFPHLNVFENIAFGLRMQRRSDPADPSGKKKVKIPEKEIHERVMEMLEIISLKGFENRKPDALSGGQQQRVAIARALVNNPQMIIADEPTGNLDPMRSLEIMMLLERINELGTTVLVVTHAKELVNRFSKRVVAIENGRIISDETGGYYNNETTI